MEKKQTIDDIINIISSVETTNVTGGFTIIDRTDFTDKKKYEYFLPTLTSSYLKFVKDIFNLKYGEINREVIVCFEDTIKTNTRFFKPSYRKTTKEIVKDSVYIHTTITKSNMRCIIDNLCYNLGLDVKHALSDEEKHNLPF
jgi:hypothetical protein